MKKILVIASASPKRVREKALEISAADATGARAQVTVLCRRDPRIERYFADIPGMRVLTWGGLRRKALLNSLRVEKFDLVYTFWTAEDHYLDLKFVGFRLGAPHRIEIGDGHAFQASPGSLIRFLAIRLKYPRPSDYYDYLVHLETPSRKAHEGERILVIESAAPAVVEQGLHTVRRNSIFRNPRFTVFCRNAPEAVERFRSHPSVEAVRTHNETSRWWGHLRELRREKFDGIVLFLTADPSYWKIKYFAFLLGARHALVFNENNDCFFFSWRAWVNLVARRMGEQTRLAPNAGRAARGRWLATLVLKTVLTPFRFFWLLLVWIRLRTLKA